MTKLSARKTKLQFTTDAEVRYRGKLREVIVEVNNGFTASVRLKGPGSVIRSRGMVCTIGRRIYLPNTSESGEKPNARKGEKHDRSRKK